MSSLGDGGLNLPYEENPPGQEGAAPDALFAGGVAVMGVTIPLYHGHAAGVMYRFAKTDGSGFYQPIALFASDDELFMLNKLTRDAVASAVRTAKSLREGKP